MTPRIPLPRSISGRAFTTAEGLAAGLGPERLRGRDLQRPFRGVLVDAPGSLTLLERCSALQRRLPSNAFFCGITAAALLGVPIPGALERSPVVHVAVPSQWTAPTGRGIQGHSYEVGGEDLMLWRDLKVSTPERLWCELAEALQLPDLVAAGDHLIHGRHPLTGIARLTTTVSRYRGRRGIGRLRAALPLLNERAESPQESRLRVIVLRAGIEGVVVNLPITTTGGYRYRADLAIPRARLIIEYQGDIHRSAEAFRADMTRASRLEADGWQVMFVNADDLRNDIELLERIRRRIGHQPIG